MEGFCFLDSENVGPGGKMNLEIHPKKQSLGLDSVGRKRLSDITNSHSQQHLKPLSFATKEYIEQLQKENTMLRQHLQERNKLLELTGVELTKMRINMQKLQQQNRLLAQTNSQMTLERTLDKDRLKVLQHEVGCRGSLLAIKEMELEQEKVEKKPCQKPCTTKKSEEVTGEAVEDGGGDIKPRKINQRRQSRTQSALGSSAAEEQVEAKERTNRRRQSRRIQSLESFAAEEQVEAKEEAEDKSEVKVEPEPAHGAEDKSCNLNGSRRSRTQSLGSSAMKERVTAKENPDDKREHARFKYELQEPTDEKSDNKRLCLRRQSARHKPEHVEPTEDLFEIEDTRFPTSTLLDENMQDVTTSSTTEEVKERETDWNCDTPALRTSIGRPMRRAAVKVQCYKEIPLNVKMRRAN